MADTIDFLTGSEAERRLAGDAARFWQLVMDTFCKIFDQHDPGIVERYRQEVDRDGSRQERLLVYHSSPLQIAADLAGVTDRQISGDEQAEYIELQRASLEMAGIDMS